MSNGEKRATDEMIINSYKELNSAAKVAAIYGISNQTVYYTLSRCGVPTLSKNEKRQLKVTDDEIVSLYHNIGSGVKVAKHFGINDRTVYKILEQNGIDSKEYRRRPRVFNDKECIDKLLVDYSNGKSAVKLAKENNCSIWTILSTLDRFKVEIRRITRMTPDEIKTAKELYESGMTFKQVATLLGRSDIGIIRNITKYYPEIIRSNVLGPGGPHWKGGKSIDTQGYVQVWVSNDDPMIEMAVVSKGGSSKYIPEHRLTMARKLGRVLLRTETVHHIDGNRQNNSPENLQLRQGKHGKHVVMCCLDCGSRNISYAGLD